MYKIKTFENNVKANLDDDFALAVKYFKDVGNLDVVFERNKTNVKFADKVTKLAVPNDGTCDVVFYIFDRIEQNQTVPTTIQFSNKTSLCWMPTGIPEDAIGFHWHTLCHELIHSFACRLRTKGIPTLIDFEMDKYDQNDFPNSPNGNFSRALAILKPYWCLLGATTPTTTPWTQVEIVRSKGDDNETLGILTATNNGAKFTCKTLELAEKGNQPNISCIPPGIYTVKWTFSPRLLRFTYEVQNVPGRSGIRLHPSNFYNELKGCVALGNNVVDLNGDGILDVTSSKQTTKAFEDFMQRKTFSLKIK